jgi:hypothetical protein
MISRFFPKKRLWLAMLCLSVASSVQAEIANVGPMDRLYEYLFFDGHIESGTNELDIFSGLNDNGIWKASTSVNNDWKTASTATWQDTVIVYNPGKPEYILPDRFPKDSRNDEPTKAQFIWAPNADGSENGKNGPEKAYFSYTFNLDNSFFNPQNTLTASANVLADDFFAMSVNGYFVGNGLLDTQIANNPAHNGLGAPVELDFAKWLKDGSNTISIFAYDGYKVEKENLINSDTISANPSGSTMNITFTPSDAGKKIQNLKDITISDAADILGYDHFNWYQVGKNSKFVGNPLVICDPNLSICTDPPISYFDTQNIIWNCSSADTEPFYWDEFGSENCQGLYLKHISNNVFSYMDTPTGPHDYVLDTFLVGVNEKKSSDNNGWIPLSHVQWETKCAGGNCSIQSPDDISVDSEMIGLGVDVKACMKNDGALEPNSGSNILGSDTKECFKEQNINTVPEPTELALIFLGLLEIYLLSIKRRLIILK